MVGNVNDQCDCKNNGNNHNQDSVQAMSATPLVELIIAIQNALVMLDYDPGRTDGILGPLTTKAIKRFQADTGLATDGQASYALFNLLYSVKKHSEKQKTPLSK